LPERWIHSIQFGLSLPTGRLKSPQELTQVDAGSGSYDLSLNAITNFRPLPRWLLSATAGGTYRFWGSRTLRVKKSAEVLLPGPEDEERVAQKLGNKWVTSLGTQWDLSDSMNLGVDYEWNWKLADRYEGTQANHDYSLLSLDTQSTSEALQLSYSWNSIQSFLKQNALLPLQVTFTAYLPLRGINSLITPYGLAELALYF
jgi:hypothetical protein